MNIVPLASLTRKHFTDCLNAEFTLELENAESLLIRLVEVLGGPSSPQVEQFALQFSSTQPPLFKQGNFRISHPGIGTFEVFMTCLGPYGVGSRYEVIFSRLLRQSS